MMRIVTSDIRNECCRKPGITQNYFLCLRLSKYKLKL